MNREDGYNRIDAIIAKYEIDEEPVTITSTLDYDALRMARKALEQQYCGDAISRQAVLDLVDSYSESQSNVEDVTQDIISDIVALPSVNPQNCDKCEVGNPCLYCKHEFEPQGRSDKNE